jgi:hypothetical protein
MLVDIRTIAKIIMRTTEMILRDTGEEEEAAEEDGTGEETLAEVATTAVQTLLVEDLKMRRHLVQHRGIHRKYISGVLLPVLQFPTGIHHHLI